MHNFGQVLLGLGLLASLIGMSGTARVPVLAFSISGGSAILSGTLLMAADAICKAIGQREP